MVLPYRVMLASIAALAVTWTVPVTHASASSGPQALPVPSQNPTTPVPAALRSDSKAVSLKSSTTCSTVQAQLATYAASGKKGVPCVASQSAATSGTPAHSANSVVDHCSTDGVINVWYYARDWFCLISTSVVIETIDVKTGLPLGSGTYDIFHGSDFNPRKTEWTNYTGFSLTTGWGDIPNIVDASNSCAGCGGASVAPPLGGPTPLPVPGQVAGEDTLSDFPAFGVVHGGLFVGWEDAITCADCVAPAILSESSPIEVRCDFQNNVNGVAGCTIPSYTPELQLTGYASGNSGTANVALMQWFNVDHWGQYPNGTPLRRLNDPAQAKANRRAMCETGVWSPDSTVPNDSCDEFPFAASYQSGNMLGLTASDCAQTKPEFKNGQFILWVFPGYSSSQRCALGHVALNYNQSVGGKYGPFIQNQRILDGDPFWIGIYN
jgi:hypothetical protein